MHRLVIAATAAGALSTSALAGPMFDRVSASCFARSYGAEHLARSPAQRVTTISLTRDRTAPAAENSRQRFTVAIRFRTRDSRERFELNGICTTAGAGAHCLGEGDTGEFRLSLQGELIRMEVVRLEVEGLGGDLTQSDDRVFLIPAAQPGACGR